MALMQMKSSAFLVGEQRLNPEPVPLPMARFLGQVEIRYQIQRLDVAPLVPDDQMNRTIKGLRHRDPRHTQEGLPGQGPDRATRAPIVDQGRDRRPADVVPAGLVEGLLQGHAVKLAITEEDHVGALRHHPTHLFEEQEMVLSREMAFFAPFDDPGYGQGAFAIDHGSHQRGAPASEGRAVEDHEQGLPARQRGDEFLGEGQKEGLKGDTLVLDKAGEALDTAFSFGLVGSLLGHFGQVGTPSGDEARDEAGQSSANGGVWSGYGRNIGSRRCAQRESVVHYHSWKSLSVGCLGV